MAQVVSQKKKLSSSSQNIKVVVRVRPLSNEEKERRVKTVVQCVSMREIQTKEKKYHFDRVFEQDSSQMDIYSFVVAPMINDVLAGYNCTVFAYGQTGTGKTHTMTGGDPNLTASLNWRIDERAGCIPRAAANIFDAIGSMNVKDYNVRVSFLELYNEEVRDLLSSEERPLPLNIFNDSKGSVCIQNLKEVTVFNSNDIYMLLQQGTLKRQTAATLMNNHSSRSHTVFTITVHTRETNLTDEEVLKTGKINLVDLAGSENIAKSGAKDKRAQELANINRSLLTLGRVIQILAEKNNKHVPYRDSKLTRILQDSLGGHTKTCIISTVSPSHLSFEETQSTLDYACRARDIRNTPMINEKVTKAEMIKEMSVEIEKLKKDLDAARSGDGFFIDRMNWEELNSQLQSSSNTVSLKNDIIEDMKKKLSELELIRDIKKTEYEDAMNTCKHRAKMIKKAKILLKEARTSLKQEQFLSRCYLEAATAHENKAKELLEATKSLSRNQDILQKKLENQYFNNYTNEKIINEKSCVLTDNLAQVLVKLDHFHKTTSTDIVNHRSNLASAKNRCDDFASNAKMTWELDSRPALRSECDKHSQLIKATCKNNLEDLSKYREEVVETLDLLNDCMALDTTVQEKFEVYDDLKSGQINKMKSLIINLRGRLLNKRKEKEATLQKIKIFEEKTREDLEDLDDMLNSIELSEVLCSDSNEVKENVDKKLEIKTDLDGVERNLQLLSQTLRCTTDKLDTQRARCFESEQRLVESSRQVEATIDQIIHHKLDTDAAFFDDNHTSLEALEGNAIVLEQAVENRISEIGSILQNMEEMANRIASEIIPVKRAGDTPKQKQLNYPKRISEANLSRDVLIKRFKDEYKEDVENESFHLNVSSQSEDPLNDSDDNNENSRDFLDCV